MTTFIRFFISAFFISVMACVATSKTGTPTISNNAASSDGCGLSCSTGPCATFPNSPFSQPTIDKNINSISPPVSWSTLTPAAQAASSAISPTELIQNFEWIPSTPSCLGLSPSVASVPGCYQLVQETADFAYGAKCSCEPCFQCNANYCGSLKNQIDSCCRGDD